MNNKEQLEKHYQAQRYKYLGYVNINEDARVAAQTSTDKQWHQVGKCLHLVALHDLKAYVLVDSGD